MRVFFTSVLVLGEGKGVPEASRHLDRILNEALEARDYGSGLTEWFLVFLFQRAETDPPRGRERMLYKRAANELDLRLFGDHEAWRRARQEGDIDEQYRLLYDIARRSFDIMRRKKVHDFDVDAFERDVEAIATEQGWTR